MASDCLSGHCSGAVCRADHCANDAQDGDETAADCGGSCGECASAECEDGAQCASGVCVLGGCVAAACDDTLQNGTETDIDCGGGCVAEGRACLAGATCETSSDCAEGACDGTCQSATSVASCSDGVHNGDETGEDCGGGCASIGQTCPEAAPCDTGTDCQSGVCSVTCQAPTCYDGVQNGTESTPDCGPQCPPCVNGSACVSGEDCASGVCGPSNQCANPPCTCEPASCSDGVQNQDELGVDCAGVCLAENKTCPVGTPCESASDCGSGFCNDTCRVSSCSPPDGIPNGFETDVDCGGVDCPPCLVGAACLEDDDCAPNVCDSTLHCVEKICGDGLLTADEVCDNNGTATFADDDVGAATCADYGFVTGEVGCSPSCTLDPSACSGRCGNGIVDLNEQCDGDNLNGLSCASLGYDDGDGLTCSSRCGLDATGCPSSLCPVSCPTGAYCSSSTANLCECPVHEGFCDSGCVNFLTDPDNCGHCGVVCGADEACSAGQCQSVCPSPLIRCAERCVDPQVDFSFCGATQGCGVEDGSAGEDCIALYGAGSTCLSGTCVDASAALDLTQAGDAVQRCVGGGPSLDFNAGLGCDPTDPDDPDCVVDPSVGCPGDLASVTFRYALCSCSDVDTSHPLFADGFNSSLAPYSPRCEDGSPCFTPGGNEAECSADANGDGHFTCADQLGAGIGANGTFSNSQLTTVWGSLWLANGDPATYPDQSLPVTTIAQELRVGAALGGGPIHVGADAHVVGDATATGTVEGTLFQSAATTSSLSAGAVDRSEDPLAVGEACDCSAAKLIDVAGIVDAHACAPEGTAGCAGVACCDASNNNNADIGLDPTQLESIGEDVRLDLPCGKYSFSSISASNNTTVSIVVHGRTAIFVDEHVDIPKILNLTLTDAAELDVFVKGGVCNNDTLFVGSPSYPARVRVYVGGGSLFPGGSATTCATNSDRALALKSVIGAANIYAPYGEVYMPQTFTLYGSIFAGRAAIVQSATFHFDTGIIDSSQTCKHCGNGLLEADEQCDGSALGGMQCSDLGFTGGPLRCAPNCTFDVRPCCGDGTRAGAQECDGEDVGGLTCADLGQEGTLSCSASCTFEGCSGARCLHDGVLDSANGEECDPGVDPQNDADVFPTGRDTCTGALGIPASGTLACLDDCTVDTSACAYCGDGLVNGPEESCDGDDYDPADGVQRTPPTCPNGVTPTTCAADCSVDHAVCVVCESCRDCNNQACVDGVCGPCTATADCCAPLLCVGGTCRLY